MGSLETDETNLDGLHSGADTGFKAEGGHGGIKSEVQTFTPKAVLRIQTILLRIQILLESDQYENKIRIYFYFYSSQVDTRFLLENHII